VNGNCTIGSGERLRHRLVFARRLILAAVFAWAGVSKVVDPVAEPSSALPALVIVVRSLPVTIVVVFLEVGIAFLLLTPKWRIGIWLVISASLVFVLYLLALLSLGVEARECGCFGNRYLDFEQHLALNFGLLLVAISCFWQPRSDIRAGE
jgi:uncharacterized membrane protein YphA (DoxX/SURF4 family)